MQTAPKLITNPPLAKLPCEIHLEQLKRRVAWLEKELAELEANWRPNGNERDAAIELRRAAAAYFEAAKSTDALELATRANAQHALGTAIYERVQPLYTEYLEGKRRLRDQLGAAEAAVEKFELIEMPELREQQERERAQEEYRQRATQHLVDLARPDEIILTLADGSQVIKRRALEGATV